MRWLVVVLLFAGCRQLFGLEDPKPVTDARHDSAGPSDGQNDATADGRAEVDASAACIAKGQLMFGGHHYYLLTVSSDWNVDKATCEGDGGHLVKIETMAENTFVQSTFTTANIWIGLSDPTMTDTYVWTDGTPLGAYNDFPNGTIPMSNHDCVAMDATSWKVLDCVQGLPGVCECE